MPDIDDPDGHYTYGDEFALPDSSEYVGYYHVELDENGDTIYVSGASSGDNVEGGEILSPFSTITKVDIGDIEWSSVDTSAAEVPFVIEKYILVNGTETDWEGAVSLIRATTDDLTQNISDVYPGELDFVTDVDGRIVGLTGDLGIRYGLRFGVIIDGSPHTITEVEINALDVSLSTFINSNPIDGGTKLLLCLINLLIADDKFKLTTQYIFPFKKQLATLAIYNGMAFLPSIGEKVAADGETYGKTSVTTDDTTGYETKLGPGVSLVTTRTATDTEQENAGDHDYTSDSSTGDYEVEAGDGTIGEDDATLVLLNEPLLEDSSTNPGSWASKVDRDPGFFGGLFLYEYDGWDQTLLRNSRSRVKKIFRSFYDGRDFRPGDTTYDSPGAIITDEFKSRFKLPAGQDLLPWWKRRLQRTNPFNASGELCEEKD